MGSKVLRLLQIELTPVSTPEDVAIVERILTVNGINKLCVDKFNKRYPYIIIYYSDWKKQLKYSFVQKNSSCCTMTIDEFIKDSSILSTIIFDQLL